MYRLHIQPETVNWIGKRWFQMTVTSYSIINSTDLVVPFVTMWSLVLLMRTHVELTVQVNTNKPYLDLTSCTLVYTNIATETAS